MSRAKLGLAFLSLWVLPTFAWGASAVVTFSGTVDEASSVPGFDDGSTAVGAVMSGSLAFESNQTPDSTRTDLLDCCGTLEAFYTVPVDITIQVGNYTYSASRQSTAIEIGDILAGYPHSDAVVFDASIPVAGGVSGVPALAHLEVIILGLSSDNSFLSSVQLGAVPFGELNAADEAGEVILELDSVADGSQLSYALVGQVDSLSGVPEPETLVYEGAALVMIVGAVSSWRAGLVRRSPASARR